MFATAALKLLLAHFLVAFLHPGYNRSAPRTAVSLVLQASLKLIVSVALLLPELRAGIPRLPKITNDDRGRFTDYFLVGTLTSVGIALLGGILLRVAGVTIAE